MSQENASFRLERFRGPSDTAMIHGIKITDEGDPVIPCLTALIELGQSNPDCKEFQWLCEDRKWVCIRV